MRPLPRHVGALSAWAVLALVAGCGSGPPITTDAGCGMAGVPADQPSIGCPSEVDLGCVPAGGAPISYEVATASCDGSPVIVSCDPMSGATVLPPSAGGSAFATCTATAPSGASAACTFPIRMRVMGPPSLACAPAFEVACSGPRTMVTVPPAAALDSCDGPGLPAPSNDAPADGFGVGSRDVTFTTMAPTGPLTCTTTVTVTDDEAPTITCPTGAQTVIRSAPSDLILNFRPPTSDACDSMVDVMVAPMPTGRGDTAVVATAIDDAGNRGSCNATIRVLDVFAPTHFRMLSAARAGDGTTDVTLGWEATSGLDTEELLLERGTARAGPFTEVMRLPPTTLTFTDAALDVDHAFYRITAIGPSGTRGGTTDVVEAFAVDAPSQYDVGGAAVPGVPFATSLYGVVRHPVDLSAGPYPLVLFLHGNHGNCRPRTGDDECEERTTHACTDPRFTTTPNAEGYIYLMETLAAQGYVTASLSANALNCRDDYIPQRTALILEHMRRWAARSLPLPAEVMMAADTMRTSLVGHSRGGEAVSQVPEALRATPVTGAALASVLALGPTDFHSNAPTGVPYLSVLPGCDADVATLEGARMVDRGAAALDGEIHGHVLFVGANHNFFNTEWRFDDNAFGAVCATASRLAGTAIRGGFEDLLSTWLRFTVRGANVPEYFRAESPHPESLDAWAGVPLDLRFAYFSPSRLVIHDFTMSSTNVGGAVMYSGYTAATACSGTCASNYAHVADGSRLAWEMAAATASFGAASSNGTPYTSVSIRFASRTATLNTGIAEHDFTVRVTDADGTAASVLASEVGRVPGTYRGLAPREVLTTLRVPLARLSETAGFDVGAIDRIEVAMPVATNPQGSIWIADVELAGD